MTVEHFLPDVNEEAIQQADANDAEDLAAVYQSAYQENRQLGFPAKAESATPEIVETWIVDHEMYVAIIDDEICGGVRLEATDSERVKLSRLAVHEEWKGNGIGSRLLDYVESVVQRKGYSTIWLTTPEEHPYLPEFYQSHGYEQTGDYPLEYRDYDEIIMEKQV